MFWTMLVTKQFLVPLTSIEEETVRKSIRTRNVLREGWVDDVHWVNYPFNITVITLKTESRGSSWQTFISVDSVLIQNHYEIDTYTEYDFYRLQNMHKCTQFPLYSCLINSFIKAIFGLEPWPFGYGINISEEHLWLQFRWEGQINTTTLVKSQVELEV